MSDKIPLENVVPPEVFELTPAEQMSPLWQKIDQHLNKRLNAARAQNDKETLDIIQTAKLRGQIATLKSLIALGDTSPVMLTDG